MQYTKSGVSGLTVSRTNEESAVGITGQEHMRRMLDKSLQNLGVDHVDLYTYHMWDHLPPMTFGMD